MAIVGVASVRIKPDLTEFRKELNAGLKAIKAEIEVNVKANTVKAKSEVEAFVRKESGKDIVKKVKIDKNSLVKAATALSGLSGSLTKVVVGSLAFVAMQTALQGIIPLLTATLGIALLIPGALLPLVGIMGAIKLGADGAKRAFDRLKPTMDTLKSQVSATFERALLPAVNDLKKILPGLRTGFQSVASEIGGVASRLTAMLRANDNTRILNGVLTDTGKILRNLSPAVTSLVEAFIRVAKIGTEVFVEMTNGAGEASKRLVEFTRSAEGVAIIREKIQVAIDAFKTLGQIIVQVVAIFAALFSGISAGAGGMGSTLLPTLRSINAALSDGKGRAALEALGRALAALGRAFSEHIGGAIQAALPVLTRFFDFVAANADFLAPLILGLLAFTKLAPIVIGIVTTLQTVFSGLFAMLLANPIVLVIAAIVGLLHATDTLQPLIQLLKDAFNALMPPLKALGQALLPPIKRLFEALKPAMQKIVAAFGRLLKAILPIMIVSIELAAKVLPMLIDILIPVIVFVVDLAAAIIDFLVSAIEIAIDVIKSIIHFFANFGDIMGEVLDDVGGFFTDVGSSIGGFFSDLISDVGDFFAGIGRFFAAIPGKIGAFLSSLPAVIGNAFKWALTEGLHWVSEGIQWIIAEFIAFPVQLLWLAGALIGVLSDAFGAAFEAVTTAIHVGVDATLAFFRRLPGWILDAIVFLAQGVATFFANVWNGAWRITSDIITNIVSFVKALPGKIMSGISSLIGSVGRFFSDVFQGAKDAVGRGIDAVVDFFRGLPGAIGRALGNLGSLLLDAGRAIIDGLLRGIKAAVQAVFDFVSGIANKIASLKGPLPKDRKLLVPAGLAIMGGLLRGIQEGLRPVLDFAGGIADQIGASVGGASFDMTSRLQTAIGATVSADGEFGQTPVIVNVGVNEGPLRDFVNIEIDQGNRDVRRAVKAGGVV